MTKLLSICIPTYNRAIELDRQLAWLAQEIKGFESDCEVIVSDNASTDETQAILAKWQPAFAETTFKTRRNAENLGWMRNFVCCYEAAVGKYTWLIGDDDVVYAGALSKVLEEVRSRPVSLLYLNFLGRHKDTGEIMEEHWFDPDVGTRSNSGQIIFEHCIAKNIGSVIFITSVICRTDLALTAVQKWPESVNNWGGAAFWYGYCAMHGEVVVTPENYVECAIGVSYWQKDPRAWFRIRHYDIPEIFVKLQGIGYPLDFCRDRIVALLREDFLSAHSVQHLTEYLRSLKHKPLWTIKILAAFFTMIGASFVGFAPLDRAPSDSVAQSSL